MSKNIIKKIHEEFLNLNIVDRKNIILVAINLFAILFSYPFIRSASTAIFVEFFGAKNTPWVWILSVLGLIFSVGLFNKWQTKKSIYYLYKAIVVLTVVIFSFCNLLYFNGYDWVAFPYYVWKEVYIVLLVHLSIGYLNSKVDYKVAKLTYGPLGAIGSFGGVLGGVLTSKLVPFVNNYQAGLGLLFIGVLGIVIVLSTLLLFRSTKNDFLNSKKEETPLSSVTDVKGHVFLMASVVMISQFVINLANFKFNLGLEQYITGAQGKGEFLGKVYSFINLISFVFQVLLIPIILKVFRVKWVHISIPVIFSLLLLSTFSGLGFVPVTILFVSYKGLDYSLFSTAKEMLYFPLSKTQKFGAKYIVDMIVYRSSKMLISSVLILFNTAIFVDSLLVICLIIWIILTTIFLSSDNKFLNQTE